MPQTIGNLITDHGERSTYDAVSQCSRCGYCEQVCPTYVVTGKESFSGRGRNQIVRMMMEGKFKDSVAATEALSTCLLCGACTSACYAHVRTADLVLEGRRMLAGNKIPWVARILTWFMEYHPKAFAQGLKVAYFIKRLGVSRFLSSVRIMKLLGLKGLEAADRHVQETPRAFLSDYLAESPGLDDFTQARWLYFAPCGPNYLYPKVGLSTIAVLQKAVGVGASLNNDCCGLLAYNYGGLDAARRFAQRNIENFEKRASSSSGDGGERLPLLVGDCSSCVAHLKMYPQLFLEKLSWKARAENFAKQVRDIIEIPVPAHFPQAHKGQKSLVVTYHDSCRARNGEGVVSEPRGWMRALFGDAFVEMPEPHWCCGGAGAFAFNEPELSDQVLRHKIDNIASIRAGLVVTSSTSCLIQLAHGLKKYYPECRVVHLSELAAEAFDAVSRFRASPSSDEAVKSYG